MGESYGCYKRSDKKKYKIYNVAVVIRYLEWCDDRFGQRGRVA